MSTQQAAWSSLIDQVGALESDHRSLQEHLTASNPKNNNNNNNNKKEFVETYFLPEEKPLPPALVEFVRQEGETSGGTVAVSSNVNPKNALEEEEKNKKAYPRQYLLQLTLEDTYHPRPHATRLTLTEKAKARQQGDTAVTSVLKSGTDFYQTYQRLGNTNNINNNNSGKFLEKTSTLSRGFISIAAYHNRYRRVDFTPIFILPSDVSAPFTLYNIKHFLEKGEYVDSSQFYVDASTGQVNRGETKPPFVIVSPGSFLDRDRYRVKFDRFMLIDDPEKFLSEHNNNHNNNNTAPQWSHVCACMTTGKESQFASWFPEEVRRRSASQLHHQKKKNKRRRGEGNEEEGTAQWILSINRLPTDKRTCRPSLLFSLIKGFLPYFEEDKVPPAVGEWRVEPLKLSRSTLRQYSHVAAASTLWEQLYTFLDHHPFFKEYTVPEKRTA